MAEISQTRETGQVWWGALGLLPHAPYPSSCSPLSRALIKSHICVPQVCTGSLSKPAAGQGQQLAGPLSSQKPALPALPGCLRPGTGGPCWRVGLGGDSPNKDLFLLLKAGEGACLCCLSAGAGGGPCSSLVGRGPCVGAHVCVCLRACCQRRDGRALTRARSVWESGCLQRRTSQGAGLGSLPSTGTFWCFLRASPPSSLAASHKPCSRPCPAPSLPPTSTWEASRAQGRPPSSWDGRRPQEPLLVPLTLGLWTPAGCYRSGPTARGQP